MSNNDINMSDSSSDRKMNLRAANSSFRLPEGVEEEFHKRVEILRQMSSEQLLHELKRDLDDIEMDLIHKISQQIVYLQHRPDSWLGNIVRRVRRACGNPSDDDVEQVVLPPANDILSRARRKQALFKRRFGRGPKSDIEHGGDQVALENILTLNDALDCALRYLLAYKLYQAKAILSLALRIYPQDLRLYKLYGWILLRDRTLNWRAVRLQQGLYLFDRLREPDAEIWAIRGDIGSSLWKLERGQRHLVDQALVCYTQSFQMAQSVLSDPAAVTYPMRKAAVLSSEIYALSMRESEVNQQIGLQHKNQTYEYLNKLLKVVNDTEGKYSSSELYDWYFAKLFALLGLNNLKEATKVAELLRVELSYEKSTDDLAEETTKDLFDSLVRIILFSGVAIPNRDEEDINWHPAWKLIQELFSHGIRGATITRELLASSVRGRIGISLSGGGLRAAFMHLGLLARMAECGMLKPLSSISCVSGGCLVGAHLYLLTKRLLESKRDEDITNEDYIVIVQDMIKHFWNATHNDLYANTLINPIRNLRIAFGKLRRIQLLGDQFHEYIFRHAYNENDKAFHTVKWEKPWRMRDGIITPKGWNPRELFAPRVHNWRRTHKAPALYLNATNLNTGHLFRFTGLYMGEKADMHGGDLGVNRNNILESVRYSEIEDPRYRNIAFADCVAISQLMPGVFDPYELKDLYGNMTVKLIDGGIFDNAGLASLLHANTDYLIANEMSAILKDLDNPGSGALSVLLRILDISGDLNFERVMRFLKDRLQNWGVKDICFVHSQQVDLMSASEREALYYHRRVPARTRDLRKKVLTRMLHRRKQSEKRKSEDDSVLSRISEVPNMLRIDTNESAQPNIDNANHNLQSDDWINTPISKDKSEGLDLAKILHTYLVEFRTSIDVITDVEKSALMATGYKLACEALDQSSRSALVGGQFFRLVDVIPSTMLSPSSPNNAKKFFDDDMPENLKPLAALTGCGNGEWAFFDTGAEKRGDWAFSPMTELLEVASNVRIPTDNPMQYTDREKLARTIRDDIDIDDVTDNPALRELYNQLKLVSVQLSVMRMLKVSWKLAILYVLIPVLLVIALYAYGAWDFADFYTTDGQDFTTRSCLCIFERPLFYLLLFIAFVVLFIRPGYVSRILIATVVMPFYYFGTTTIFDPYLLRRGDINMLIDKHRKHVALEPVNDVLKTPKKF